ncbi:hypothetical protein C8R45DRAFT_1086403 [Mycena sanguinolenta]|nr:hypothetical protein C8R45DRAFT_1086403 [Mycena sanguinolenta]
MPDIPQTLGALLIGGLFATLFAGVVNLQTIFYWRTYQKDPLPTKVLIFAVWVLDNLHTSFIWAGLWYCLIHNYGMQNKVDSIPWCIALTVIITALVTFLVHCFFAHRIYLLSKKNWFMTLPILALTLLRLVAASVSTWEIYVHLSPPVAFPSCLSRLRYRSFDMFRLKARWIFTLGLSVSSGVDVLITVLLVYLFRKNRTGTGRFNHVLDRLMLYGLETGSLTCLGTIITMLLWVITPKRLIFLGLHVVITKRTFFLVFIAAKLKVECRIGRSNASSDQHKEHNPVIFLEHRAPKSHGTLPDGLSDKMAPELQINVQTQTNVRYDGESIASFK